MNKLNNADTLRFRVAELVDDEWKVYGVSLYWFKEEGIPMHTGYIADKRDVSRFTGLRDGAGVEIWEGDLLQYMDEKPLPVLFEYGTFGINYGEFDGQVSFAERGDPDGFLKQARVVGNVWHGITNDAVRLALLIYGEKMHQACTAGAIGLSPEMQREIFGAYTPVEELVAGTYDAELRDLVQKAVVAGALTPEIITELRASQGRITEAQVELVSRILHGGTL